MADTVARRRSKRDFSTSAVLLTCLSAYVLAVRGDWSAHVMDGVNAPADAPYAASYEAASPFSSTEASDGMVDFTVAALFPKDAFYYDANLMQQWESGFNIAVSALSNATLFPQYAQLRARSTPLYVSCNRDEASSVVSTAVESGRVTAFVGPVCSEAALGAAEAARINNAPMITFAATSTFLADRINFASFFRTVYADDIQGVAIIDLVAALQWTTVTILHIEDSYGVPLAQNVEALLQQLGTNIVVTKLSLLEHSDPDYVAQTVMALAPNSPVILAVPPVVALSIIQAAADSKDTLASSWWFLGTDGVSAMDLLSVPDEKRASVIQVLQGQLGLVPHVDASSEGSLVFLRYWKEQDVAKFPGYPDASPGVYVLQLFDAVWALFEAVRIAQEGQPQPVSSVDVIRTLQGENFYFQGCTGPVEFDTERGDRKQVDGPLYDIVNFQGEAWKVVGTWSSSGILLQSDILAPPSFVGLSVTTKDSPLAPAPGPMSKEDGSSFGAPTPLIGGNDGTETEDYFGPSPTETNTDSTDEDFSDSPDSAPEDGDEEGGDDEPESDGPSSEDADGTEENGSGSDANGSPGPTAAAFAEAKAAAAEGSKGGADSAAKGASTQQSSSSSGGETSNASKKSHGTNKGLIIGVVIAGLAVLVASVASFIWYKKNSRYAGTESKGTFKQLSGNFSGQL